MSGRKFILCFLILTLSAAGWAVEAGWNAYGNERFGYDLETPDFLVPGPEPENADGRTFRSSDGKAGLAVWGSWNALGGTVRDMYDVEAEGAEAEGAKVLEGVLAGNGYTLVTQRGGEITARCCMVKGDLIAQFRLTYPEGEAGRFKPAFERMVQSFKFSREPR